VKIIVVYCLLLGLAKQCHLHGLLQRKTTGLVKQCHLHGLLQRKTTGSVFDIAARFIQEQILICQINTLQRTGDADLRF